MQELETKFDHKKVEANKYQIWLKHHLFEANTNSDKKPYSIILPPPNVTGKLHLGHAWDGTLQDILIRYHHLLGYETMWIAGMDHAGIATQAKVEQRLAEQGISRYDLGRSAFLDKSWQWKEEYASIIRQQWAKLGFALDYSKEKFTLDEDVNQRVFEVFKTLYDKGYIYQGYKITNWDPAAKTAISDIEVIYKETQGYFYYLKYYFEDENKYLEIATTRPETIFGDQAIAVNPNDSRYKQYIGKKVIIPGVNRVIPIIADDYVDMEFGSGIVKITPAHDPNDYEVGLRHNLKMPLIMNLDGSMNENCGKYANLDRFLCRKQLIADLQALDLVAKIEDYTHNVGYSERSGCVVETILSKQWFIKMKELAKQAIAYQQTNEKINFFPSRFEKTFIQWMENINDWCISRQLWWGHRIPVWYEKDSGAIIVSNTKPGDNYYQDEDVLDTWFSSALWPIVTTIWRSDNENMEKFFPTNILVTGYDIIFFWVSRMIFQAIEFTQKKPFDDVLIHGLIRASDGRKMSKSLGNGIDPMDVVDTYGADSLRLFLISNSAPGLDLRYSEEKLEASWNFLNKFWNVSRYVFLNTQAYTSFDINLCDQIDFYIIDKFNMTNDKIKYYMAKYEFGEAIKYLMNFIKDEFSSWYIEACKIYFNQEHEISINKKGLMHHLLNNMIIMLSPFAPFITDTLYISLNKKFVYNASWPENININQTQINQAQQFNVIKEIITSIRNFREQNNIGNKKPINIVLETKLDLTNSYDLIKRLANVNNINEKQDNQDIISVVLNNVTLHIINEDLIDHELETQKLLQQLDSINNEIKRSLKMLCNENFINKASKSKIEAEKAKANNYLKNYLDTIDLLGYNIENEDVISLREVLANL